MNPRSGYGSSQGGMFGGGYSSSAGGPQQTTHHVAQGGPAFFPAPTPAYSNYDSCQQPVYHRDQVVTHHVADRDVLCCTML